MNTKAIKDRLLKILKDRGYKLTPQRNEIIEIIAQDRSHPSAQDILQKARKRIPQLSTSTVYYTLDLFKREGVIKELEFYNMENRYEGDIRDHLNLVCMECGKVQDFYGQLPLSNKIVEKRTGFRPLKMRFEYYGYCRECSKQKPG